MNYFNFDMTQEEADKVYRNLSARFHSDRNPELSIGDELFMRLREEYEAFKTILNYLPDIKEHFRLISERVIVQEKVIYVPVPVQPPPSQMPTVNIENVAGKILDIAKTAETILKEGNKLANKGEKIVKQFKRK